MQSQEEASLFPAFHWPVWDGAGLPAFAHSDIESVFFPSLITAATIMKPYNIINKLHHNTEPDHF